MGHRAPGPLMIYLHSTDERQRAIADALDALAATELDRKPKRAGGRGEVNGHATGTEEPETGLMTMISYPQRSDHH